MSAGKVTILGGGPSARSLIGKLPGPVIGCNVAPLYQKCIAGVWVDSGFWTKWGPQLTDLGIPFWTNKPHVHDVHSLPIRISNSGAFAIWVAMHLGYREIWLAGFDQQCDQGESNWHTHYNRVTHTHKWYRDTWGHDFIAIKNHALSNGISILNMNPKSKLSLFPYLKSL